MCEKGVDAEKAVDFIDWVCCKEDDNKILVTQQDAGKGLELGNNSECWTTGCLFNKNSSNQSKLIPKTVLKKTHGNDGWRKSPSLPTPSLTKLLD